MTTTNYFTLKNSNNTLEKRFKVLAGNYIPIKEKTQSVRKTINGKLDISQGSIFNRYEFVLRLKTEEDDLDYGTLGDIDIFFEYNEPNSTPSNLLQLTDHYGTIHNVVFGQEFVPQPLGVMLEGPDAIYTVKVVFFVVPD